MRDDLLRGSLTHATARLYRMVNREHGRAAKASGLSAEQAHILTVLWTTGPRTVGELGRALGLSSPSLTGALDRLEARRLVKRTAQAGDKRSYLVESRANALVRDRALASISRTTAACFAALSRHEQEELLRLVTKVTDALEASEPRRDVRTEPAHGSAHVTTGRRARRPGATGA